MIAALPCARCQESTLEAREVKPKFNDGAFVSASFGVPVRSTTRMVIKGEPMYDALSSARVHHTCLLVRALARVHLARTFVASRTARVIAC